MPRPTATPMRIRLEGERRERIVRAASGFFEDRLDLELSDFQVSELVDFFVHELGAPVYNQAIRDAHAFLQEKLTDLEGDFYEPESESPR